MMIDILVEVSMSENDRRLLTVALVVLLVLFIFAGLLGMLIRFINGKFAERVDLDMGDVAKFGVVTNAKQFRELANKKNNRLFFKQSTPPMLIGLTSLVVYIVYSLITHNWGENFWKEWTDLFYVWKFGDPAYYHDFWGLNLLTRWPDLEHGPFWNPEHTLAYILVTMWVVAIVYMLVVSQAFIARSMMIDKRAKSAYKNSMDKFNYYDTINAKVDPMKANAEASKDPRNPQQ